MTPTEKKPTAVIHVDASGVVTQVNASTLEMLGRPEESLVGSFYGRFLTIAHVSDSAEPMAADDPVISSLRHDTAYRVFGVLRGADRLLRPIEGYVAPTYDAARHVHGTVLMLELESDALSCTTRPIRDIESGWQKLP